MYYGPTYAPLNVRLDGTQHRSKQTEEGPRAVRRSPRHATRLESPSGGAALLVAAALRSALRGRQMRRREKFGMSTLPALIYHSISSTDGSSIVRASARAMRNAGLIATVRRWMIKR
jgi:hypothetical protein